MKKIILSAILLCGFCFAENLQNYNSQKAGAEHFVNLSREQVSKNNLTLAKAYAKKAVQADPFNKKAWESYDDVIQRLADEGLIDEFGAKADESEVSAPKPSGGAQFEGC